MPTRSHFPKTRTALLLIDVINPFDFPGGRPFARKATRPATKIAALRVRAKRAKLPVVYVNDNLGKWRSDVSTLVAYCSAPGMPGASICNMLAPSGGDYVVLKSTLSGFYQTPLETMLRLGGVRHLILTGFAADNCVLFTAADAYMRDFRLSVPVDCIAAESTKATRNALGTMQRLFGASTTRSDKLRLSRQR